MPCYDFKCENSACGLVFEAFNPQDNRDTAHKCPICTTTGRKLVTFRQSGSTFTEKLYPFYHQGIGEVVTSEKQLNKRCEELGFYSKHDGAYMTPKHERKLLSKRESQKPREVVEKVRWSGKGKDLPVLETFNPDSEE